ncbi:hypothetical protein [Janibacter hoylei]|uniref:hypothetical protein n=1 Tax=Janibacter hoylei TaxID=364298 RepID=UPI00249097F6|nr:hypothetical protein [Janibacter hoylei]
MTTTKGEGMGQGSESRGAADEARLTKEAREWLHSQPGYRPGMKQMTATHTDEHIAAAKQGHREDESQ